MARGLKLRHDHGSNYMSGDFQDEIECLGIEASPSFVRQPEGNGVAERFIRTLKENLLWVRTFDTIEELRAALVEFATRYNETWLVARHGYRTPAQVRADQCRLDPNTTADPEVAGHFWRKSLIENRNGLQTRYLYPSKCHFWLDLAKSA